jgi:hypothetical protein
VEGDLRGAEMGAVACMVAPGRERAGEVGSWRFGWMRASGRRRHGRRERWEGIGTRMLKGELYEEFGSVSYPYLVVLCSNIKYY